MYTLRTRFLCQLETASKQQEGQVEKTDLTLLPWSTLASPLIPAKWRMLSGTVRLRSHKLGKEISKRFQYQQTNLQSKYWVISKIMHNQNIFILIEFILKSFYRKSNYRRRKIWIPIEIPSFLSRHLLGLCWHLLSLLSGLMCLRHALLINIKSNLKTTIQLTT